MTKSLKLLGLMDILRTRRLTGKERKGKELKIKVKWCIYIAPLSLTSQRRFTMMKLPPADWKHIQAQIAAASKQSMHAGTHFTDLGRMES